jgi:release factor glutamine methyltransferase
MNAQELIDRAEERLLASRALDHWQKGRERLDAEDLLSEVLGEDWEADDEIPAAAARRFRRLVERRYTGEPVPYIRGYVEFRGMRLLAKRGVFVARESSEYLVTAAVRRLQRRSRPVAVDVATGSGPVALGIARALPRADVHGTDLSGDAISLARTNATHLSLTVRFHRGDLFASLPRRLAGAVDVITLHPPYVGKNELRDLPDEIRRFEPLESLTDHSPAGLGLIGRVAVEAPLWLRSGGWLLIEVSPDRARAVSTVLRRGGYRGVRSTKGGLGVTRVIAGQR